MYYYILLLSHILWIVWHGMKCDWMCHKAFWFLCTVKAVFVNACLCSQHSGPHWPEFSVRKLCASYTHRHRHTRNDWAPKDFVFVFASTTREWIYSINMHIIHNRFQRCVLLSFRSYFNPRTTKRHTYNNFQRQSKLFFYFLSNVRPRALHRIKGSQFQCCTSPTMCYVCS